MTLSATTTFHEDGSVTVETDEGTERFPDPPAAGKAIERALARIQDLSADALSLERLRTLRMVAEID